MVGTREFLRGGWDGSMNCGGDAAWLTREVGVGVFSASDCRSSADLTDFSHTTNFFFVFHLFSGALHTWTESYMHVWLAHAYIPVILIVRFSERRTWFCFGSRIAFTGLDERTQLVGVWAHLRVKGDFTYTAL